ncbi:unnamed protein product, partial [Staurois parvus]
SGSASVSCSNNRVPRLYLAAIIGFCIGILQQNPFSVWDLSLSIRRFI